MRRFLSLLLAVVLAVAALPAAGLAETGATSGPVEVTIIHDTHVHGNFVGGATNIAMKAALIKEIQSRKPGAMFVGNGDDLGTSLLSSVFKGSHVIDAYNQMGLTVNTYGNHDFDMGPEVLLERVKESKFPWVSANVRDKRTGDVFGAEVGAKKFVVVEQNGVKIGFTGVGPIDLLQVTSAGPNVEMVDYAKAVGEVLPLMKAAGAQVNIVLSHACGPDSDKLAADVEGIDAIVGDHCAEALEQPKVIGKTVVSRVGDEYRFVGELSLTVENGQVTGHSFTRHALTDKSPADPAITDLMKAYQTKLDADLLQVIGATDFPLDGMKAHNRMRETALGNYIADVTRNVVGADVAIQNGGGIRADRIVAPGLVTKKDVIDNLPFANYIMKIEVKGADIVAALEHGVGAMESGNGRFPQVSGIRFKLDASKPAGQRVSDVRIGGVPVDLTKIYTLATNSFMAGGGDGYTMFVGAKVLVDAASGPLLSTAVIDAIQKAGLITPRTEGRITFTGGVSLTAGKAELKIAGRSQPLDVAPVEQNGVYYAPLRAITELYGANVVWQQTSQSAVVIMPRGQYAVIRLGDNVIAMNGRLLVPVKVLQDLGIKVNLHGQVLELGI